MSNPSSTGPSELSPTWNRLAKVRQLFVMYDACKSRSRRAVALGVDVHTIDRIFKRGDATYQGIPKSDKLSDIAKFLGCGYNEVYLAFTEDLYPETQNCAPAMQKIAKLAAPMTDRQRRALVELAKVTLAGTTEQNADVVRYAKSVVPLWETSADRVKSDDSE